MKAEQFKEVIRKIVIEEVRKEVSKQLPKLLFEMVGQQPKQVVRENKVPVQQKPVHKADDPEEAVYNEHLYQPQPKPQRVAPQPRVVKNYTKNPVLNQILNETTPGHPQTPYGSSLAVSADLDKIGVSDEFIGEMRQIMNEEVGYSQPSVVEEPSAGPDLSKLFNKNFKAILDKSKSGHGGSFSGILQNW